MNWKVRIIAIIGVLIVGAFYFYSIMNQVGRNIERAQRIENSQISDFVEKEYEVTEVWTRTIKQKNRPSSDQSYIYFKVRGEVFNFNMGIAMTDYGTDTEKEDFLAQYLYEGAHVKVLANKDDIAYASQTDLMKTLSDFFAGSNKEVEVYKLAVGDEVIFSQDINTPPLSNRSFADIALGQNLLYLILGGAIAYAVVYHLNNFINRKKRT